MHIHFRFILVTIIGLLSTLCVFGIFADEAPPDVAKIDLDFKPGFVLVKGTKLYVGDSFGDTISVIDTTNNTLKKTIFVGQKPAGGVVSKDYIYITNFGSGTVSVVDTVTDTVKKTISVEIGPKDLKLNGNMIYISNFLSDTVSIIDTTTQSYVRTFPVGARPTFITPANGRLYVSHSASSTVSVVNITTSKLEATVTTGSSPAGSILVDGKLYVNNSQGKTVTVIETKDSVATQVSEPKTEIGVGSGPHISVLVGKKIYINNIEDGTISVIDTLKNQVVKTITVGTKPSGLLFSGTELYVYNTGSNTVSVIDTTSDSVVKNIVVGSMPVGFTFSDNKIYVANQEGKNISIIHTPPILTGITSSSPNGTYGIGEKINLSVGFNQIIKAGSTIKLLLNNGASVTLSTIDGKFLSGTYIVSKDSDITDLSIKSITGAKVIGISGLEKTAYTISSGKNLGDYKNIIIDTAKIVTTPTTAEPTLPPLGPTASLCPENRLYRLCPLEKTPENSVEYRDNLVCENIITEAQSQKKTKRISRMEVLEMAVNMLHLQRASAEEYDDVYTDIALSDQSETLELIQTGLRYKLISPTYQAFEPTKNISRIEAYALLMRSVCMEPETTESPARSIHQKAYQEGVTTKSWARFRPNMMITRSEVFIVATTLADWADKNGGCDRLVCRK